MSKSKEQGNAASSEARNSILIGGLMKLLSASCLIENLAINIILSDMISEKIQDNLALPPGNTGLPFLGEIIELVRDPQRFSSERHQKFGSIFKTQILGQPIIYVSGAKACRFILENEDIYFQNELLPNIKQLIGKNSISVQVGKEHKNKSSILRKAFTKQYLTPQVKTIEEVTQKYLDKWEKWGEFSWYPELRDYSFDVACKLFVGKDKSSELSELLKIWSEGLFTFSPNLPWTKLGRALRSRDKILHIILDIIYERQNKIDPGEDVLGILLQAQDEQGNRLSIEEIQDQILNLLFAGHETIASALTSFCLRLAQYPEVFEKAFQEQKEINTSQSLSFDQMSNFNYLKQVFKEVLRLDSPVAGGFRKTIKDCSFENYSFPKGCRVIYEISETHQDSRSFKEPKLFNPERFKSENGSFANLRDYIPFGGGKRRCLGENLANLEMLVFASKLIKNYEWELKPNQNLETVSFPLPHPADGLQVSFQKR